MISDKTLKYVSDKINEALEKKNIDIRVIYNMLDGLYLSEEYEGIKIKFPSNSLDSMKLVVDISLYGSNHVLSFIHDLTKCSIIFEIINEQWIKAISLCIE